MPLFPRQTRETVSTLREQGKTVVQDLCDTLRHMALHGRALAALFGVELQEYAAHQGRRLLALAAGVFLLLCGYLVFCALMCALLGSYIGILWGMTLVCLVHFLAAGILFYLAVNRKPGPLAPATRQELSADLQCLRILLKEEKENC